MVNSLLEVLCFLLFIAANTQPKDSFLLFVDSSALSCGIYLDIDFDHYQAIYLGLPKKRPS